MNGQIWFDDYFDTAYIMNTAGFKYVELLYPERDLRGVDSEDSIGYWDMGFFEDEDYPGWIAYNFDMDMLTFNMANVYEEELTANSMLVSVLHEFAPRCGYRQGRFAKKDREVLELLGTSWIPPEAYIERLNTYYNKVELEALKVEAYCMTMQGYSEEEISGWVIERFGIIRKLDGHEPAEHIKGLVKASMSSIEKDIWEAARRAA